MNIANIETPIDRHQISANCFILQRRRTVVTEIISKNDLKPEMQSIFKQEGCESKKKNTHVMFDSVD